jgi:hypothetical protein
MMKIYLIHKELFIFYPFFLIFSIQLIFLIHSWDYQQLLQALIQVFQASLPRYLKLRIIQFLIYIIKGLQFHNFLVL